MNRLSSHEPLSHEKACHHALAVRTRLQLVETLRCEPGLANELQAFMADVHRFGITQLCEGQPLEEWEAARKTEWNMAD